MKQNINEEKGMTFIELIVVVSIFASMSFVVLFRYRTFDRNVALQNLAQEVSLYIRETQLQAVSGVLGSDLFSYGLPYDSASAPSYGIYFNSEDKKGFYKFADNFPRNGLFDLDGAIGSCSSGECLDYINIDDPDIEIDSICAFFGGTAEPECKLKEVTILFTRPDPAPRISCVSLDDLELPCNSVVVTLKSNTDQSLSWSSSVDLVGRINTQKLEI
ncbi:type II secretion system protein [Candidatus Nomurabacteria bacterium]|nr:type II secretion system protein [Candidatus Nomurabacteria bacterium]USN94493.1 MAG: type II secretion system protein [Candidatus Nomurabacteria bacterium]